jgi:hypothetical protein
MNALTRSLVDVHIPKSKQNMQGYLYGENIIRETPLLRLNT